MTSHAHIDDAQDIRFALTLSGPGPWSALCYRAEKLAQYYLRLDGNDEDAWDVLAALRCRSELAIRESARRLSERLTANERTC